MSRRPNRVPSELYAAVFDEPREFDEKRRLAGRRIAESPANFIRRGRSLRVRSDSNPQRSYRVICRHDHYECECADYHQHGAKCKHIYAGELHTHGEFLPQPTAYLDFDSLGDQLIAALANPPGELERDLLIRQVREFQAKNRDLMHLILITERGLINSSYLRDVWADFALGRLTLAEIQKDFGLA